jgi:hypothetical protein
MPVRYQTAFLSSLGFLISFGIRCNMGVSVVAMTHNETEKYPNGTIKLIKVMNLFSRKKIIENKSILACSIRLDTWNNRDC